MVFYRDIYIESPNGRNTHEGSKKQKWWVNGFFVGRKMGSRLQDAMEFENGVIKS